MLKILIFYFTMIVGTFVGFRYRILELFAAHACRKHVCVRTHTHTYIYPLITTVNFRSDHWENIVDNYSRNR